MQSQKRSIIYWREKPMHFIQVQFQCIPSAAKGTLKNKLSYAAMAAMKMETIALESMFWFGI